MWPHGTEVHSVSVQGSAETTILNDARVRWASWMPDGRIIYSRTEDAPRSMEANLWTIDVDASTGEPRGEGRRLTDWVGFRMRVFSATADGKTFVFMNDLEQSDVWVADLTDNDARLESPQRMTLSEKMDWAGGWTRDSKHVLFYSDRAGAYDIFSQAIDDTSAQALTTSKEEQRAPRECPDAQCILFMEWAGTSAMTSSSGVVPTGGRLMRMPVSGGPSDEVMTIKGYYGWGGAGSYLAAVGGFPSFRCPTVKGALCVLAERDDASKLVTFTAFDPYQGRKRAIASVKAKEIDFGICRRMENRWRTA